MSSWAISNFKILTRKDRTSRARNGERGTENTGFRAQIAEVERG